MATWTSTFDVRATGASGATTWVYVGTLRDGKIIVYEQYNDQGIADAFRRSTAWSSTDGCRGEDSNL